MFYVKDIKVGNYDNYYNRNIQMQFLNDENFTDFMKTLCESGSNYQQVLKDYCNKFNLNIQQETPNTAVLNSIGGLLGLPPIEYFSVDIGGVLTPITSDQYILLIKGQQLKNNWDGTNQGILNALNSLFPEYVWYLQDDQNMEITIKLGSRDGNAIDPIIASLFEDGWFTPKPIAVNVRLRLYEHNNGFTVEAGGTTTEYTTFGDALDAAVDNNSSIITLYNDAIAVPSPYFNNKSVTIDLNGYTIDATSLSELATSNNQNYAIIRGANDSSKISIINSYTTKGKITGIASNRVGIVSTSVNGNLLFENFIVENNYGSSTVKFFSVGLNTGRTCTFNNVEFIGNNITNSIIVLNNGTNIAFNNCKFNRNILSDDFKLISGNAVYTNCEFAYNTTTAALGSPMLLSSDVLTITNCKFHHNIDFELIRHTPSSLAQINISNSDFYNNSHKYRKSGINTKRTGYLVILRNDTVSITNCRMFSNECSYLFYKNTATQTGISNTQIYDNTFSGENIGGDLMAFLMDSGRYPTKSATLTNVEIYNNNGFEFIVNSPVFGIGFENVNIYNNTAKYICYIGEPLYVGANVNIYDNTPTISNCYLNFDYQEYCQPYIYCDTFTGKISVKRNPSTGQVTQNYSSTSSTGTIISEEGLTVTVGTEVVFS